MLNPSDFAAGDIPIMRERLNTLAADPAKLHEQVNAFFARFDESKDNFLDRKELRHFMDAFFKEYHVHLPLTDDFVLHLFNEIDSNHDGKISPEELEAFAAKFVANVSAQLNSM